MIRYEKMVRGIPLWLLQEYLQEMGGTSRGPGQVDTPYWSARLTQIEDFQLGSLRVGQVEIKIEGEAEAMQKLQLVLEKKLLRAGG